MVRLSTCAEKTADDIRRDARERLIDQERCDVGDRTGGEDRASGRGFVVGEFGAAVVDVGSLGEEDRAGWRMVGADLVGFVTGGSAVDSFVQGVDAEEIAVFETGACEDPVVGVQSFVGGGGHDAGFGADDAEEIGLGFESASHAAFEVDFGVIGIGHAECSAIGGEQVGFESESVAVEEFDFAVESVAAEVHEFSAAIVNPVFDFAVHFAGPVLGMDADDEDLIGVEVEFSEVEM